MDKVVHHLFFFIAAAFSNIHGYAFDKFANDLFFSSYEKCLVRSLAAIFCQYGHVNNLRLNRKNCPKRDL